MVRVIMEDDLTVYGKCIIEESKVWARTTELARVYMNTYGYKSFAKAMGEVKKDLRRGLTLNKCLEMALQYAK